MASRQYNGQRSRTQSAASNATTQTAASTASTSIPMPTANNSNNTSATAAAATTAATSSGTAAASQSTAPAAIRRNLFHHHLSRKPPSSTSSGATAVTANNGTSIGEFSSGSKAAAVASAAATTDNAEIVVRDKNGGYRIDVPILPPGIAGDDGNSAGMESIDSSEREGKISEGEKEKIEASLAEMMYRSRNRQMSSEPSEILDLIHQSLRNRVAELDEDKWMYEVEEEIKA